MARPPQTEAERLSFLTDQQRIDELTMKVSVSMHTDLHMKQAAAAGCAYKGVLQPFHLCCCLLEGPLSNVLCPHLSPLQHPNMVGTGFIAFPPQKPFEKPLLFQPPTISVCVGSNPLNKTSTV